MKRKINGGMTSVSLPIFIRDTSSSTGGGLSGLTSATSGLVCEYRRQGANSWTAITLSGGTLGTWTSGGFIADGSDAGCYEVGIPDAAFASGARWVAIRLRGATNMASVRIEIELDAVNYQDAVHFGLSALPNAAAGANGGVPLGNASGRVDVGNWLGSAPNALITGRVDSNAQVVGDKTGYSLTQSFPANFSTLAITGGGAVTAGTVSDKTGYSLTQAFPANFSTLSINVSGQTTAASVVGAVGSVTADVGITQAGADKVWGTASRSLTTFGTLVSDTTTAVWAAGTRSLTTFGTLVSDIATAVWVAGNRSLTTFGSLVSDVQTGLATAASLITVNTNVLAVPASTATAVWNALTSGLTTIGSAGKLLVDNLNAAISSRLASGSYTAPDNASITAIKTKTDNIPDTPAAVGSVMTLDLTQALDTANTGDTVGGGLIGARAQAFGTWEISGLNLILKAEANGPTLATLLLDDADAPTSRTEQ